MVSTTLMMDGNVENYAKLSEMTGDSLPVSYVNEQKYEKLFDAMKGYDKKHEFQSEIMDMVDEALKLRNAEVDIKKKRSSER